MLFGREHVERYRETDGEVGHDWQGTTALLLTTIGRKSGEKHTTPLIYGTHGESYVIVASKGGAPEPPAWYLNLVANPDVELQVKADRFPAHARTATPLEKPDLWDLMLGHWPAYAEYQEKTEREIPVVIMERA